MYNSSKSSYELVPIFNPVDRGESKTCPLYLFTDCCKFELLTDTDFGCTFELPDFCCTFKLTDPGCVFELTNLCPTFELSDVFCIEFELPSSCGKFVRTDVSSASSRLYFFCI